MVTTTEEILTVNGVVLNTLAKNIESLTGRLRSPGKRTSNITVPGSHGDLWVANKKYASNIITLPMWVQGCNDDGAIPTGSNKRKEFYKRVDELVTLFNAPGLLDVRHTLPDESVRQCWAEATDVLDFTTDAAPSGFVGVVLTIPAAFWQDAEEETQFFGGVGTTIAPTNFRGGSAPMEDLVYELSGPWTSPQVTFHDGTFFRYNGVIGAGQSLFVDNGEWTLTGSNGMNPDYSKLEHDGADPVWGALPASAAAITLGGSGRTTDTGFRITGRRKFLVG